MPKQYVSARSEFVIFLRFISSYDCQLNGYFVLFSKVTFDYSWKSYFSICKEVGAKKEFHIRIFLEQPYSLTTKMQLPVKGIFHDAQFLF